MSTPSGSANRPADALARLQIQRPLPQAKGRRSSWLLRSLIAFVVLLGLGAGGVALAMRSGWMSSLGDWFEVPELIQSRPEVRLANVAVEQGRSADATVVATGYLESRRQAKIGARAPGRIEVVNVEEGTRVKANEILAILEHADLDASLAATKATLSRAKAQLVEQQIVIEQSKLEYERAEKLRRSNNIRESDYEAAKYKYEGAVAKLASLNADIELAEARVREGEQMQANMFVRAPFDGTVISKDAEVGESILPGGMGEASGRGSVVTVADLEHLEVDCDVKEDYISRIAPGQAAEVAVDAVPDRRYQGRVRKIIPMGDRARATIKVKVEIVDADERLFPDMSARAYFLPQESKPASDVSERRVFCDSAAIQKGDEGTFVWVLNDENRTERRSITAGPSRDDRTEILEGLTGDERVIIAPPDMKAGQLVKVSS